MTAVETAGFIPAIPTDPQGGSYQYAALDTNGSLSSCESYHLGATLEDSNNSALDSDVDASAGTVCTGGGTAFAGTDPIYDVTP